MKLELNGPQLGELVSRQLANLFQFDPGSETPILSAGIYQALRRCETCFGQTPNKYYHRAGEPFFTPWHSGQYSIFLYFLSHAVAKQGPESTSLADRIYYLNKALNGPDLFHQVEMPAVFFPDHPLGSVLGQASYGEFFSFSQQCTVGNNKGEYPTIGRNVKLMSGVKILGKCRIGDNVICSANTYIKDRDIPSGSLVFGSGSDLVVKVKEAAYFTNGTEGDMRP